MKDEISAREAWEEFCERLKAAGAVLDGPATPKDDLSQAEGVRKLARWIRVGLEATLEYADTAHPRIYRSVTATTLGEGETSDAHYHQAFIDGAQTYRVSGMRGEAPFIEFTVYAGKIGLNEQSRQVGALTEVELEVAADGSFELVLSPDEHAGNWIRSEPDASLLYVREYAHDWQTTRGASMNIACESSGGRPAPLGVVEVRDALSKTADFIARSAGTWAAIVSRNAAAEPNRFRVFPTEKSAASPEMPTGHRFASGYFRLAADEALVAAFNPVEVPYWGMDLTNFWFEPLSYEDHRSHVNNSTARREADGSVRIVIADDGREDPNWIDTKGHREGMLLFRWSRSNAPVPEIETRVVKRAEL